jgi:hypothetical protein
MLAGCCFGIAGLLPPLTPYITTSFTFDPPLALTNL